MTINIPKGLDARPVALLVQVASQHDSTVYLETEGKKVNAKSIMGMMSLGAIKGQVIDINATGEDEEEAVAALIKFLETQEVSE